LGTSAPHPSTDDTPILPPRGVRALVLAVLLWERAVPRLWLLAAAPGLYLLLAWSGVLLSLPVWLHGLLLALLGVGMIAALVRAGRGLRWPTLGEQLRRLERDSGLEHRPLTALTDRPVAGDDAALAVWQVHRQRLRGALADLRVAGPRSDIAARDPMALRGLLVLALVVAGMFAGPRLAERTWLGLQPDVFGLGGPPPVLDLWITPPAYTGRPPRALTATTQELDAAAPLLVPAGSRVLARVSGVGSAPRLDIGPLQQPFVPAGQPNAWQIETTVEAGEDIAVIAGRRELGRWPIGVIADQPPTITPTQPPIATTRGALRLEYTASDDYGLTAVEAEIAPADHATAIGAAPVLPLPLPGGSPTKAQEASFHDLTAHPWAGLAVTLRFKATDAIGQSGLSEPVSLILPERSFNNPLARLLIALRRDLVQRGEAIRRETGRQLSVMSGAPGAFDNDVAVYLSLRTLAVRLINSRAEGVVADSVTQLWETALYLEDGRLSAAARHLRDVQQALNEALADPTTPDSRIAALMDELRAAMGAYVAEMLKNALDDPQQMVDPDEDVSAYSPEDLARMVDRMQQMAQSGARDAARDMLADLREMMENLQAGRIAPPGQQGAGGRMMQELRALSDEQQRLMDQTFRRAQGMGDGDAATSEALSQMQRMLRDRLGQLMERMGELGADLPDALGAAELRMRAAEEALRQGTNRSAVNAQTQALQGLREGAQRLMQQLSEQQGEGEGQNQSGNGDGGRQQARDPLGRAIPGTGSDDGSDVAVPTESEMQRARRILDELRRRSAEPRRPPVERDYIERLLRRF
jgi:uncharacterized protein (TIGR02302 family)